MVCCKDCAHCAKMLHFEDEYVCTLGGKVNWMPGRYATVNTDCDFFVTVDDYLTEILSDEA